MHWAIWDAMFKAQNAFEGVISNFPNRFIGAVMRRVVFPLGRPYVVPSDKLGHEVARILIEPSAARDRLTAGCTLGRAGQSGRPGRSARWRRPSPPSRSAWCAPRSRRGASTRSCRRGRVDVVVARAEAAGAITAAEAAAVLAARDLSAVVIRVDDFPQDLGASEMQTEPPAVPIPAPPPVRHKAAA
jgi:acyl-CoA dehydrogenase